MNIIPIDAFGIFIARKTALSPPVSLPAKVQPRSSQRISAALLLCTSALLLPFSMAVGASWQPTGDLTTGREFHTATLLPDGKVLVAGGYGGDGPLHEVLASAELYDPATGVWTPTGSMNTARVSHTATRLLDGRILVAGGGLTGTITATAEIYDPSTGSWSPTGSMATPRSFHTATLLRNGMVLVVAGRGDLTLNLTSVELFDPVSGTWSPTADLVPGRYLHTATLLESGIVLVVGGTSPHNRITTAQGYRPTIGDWVDTPQLASTHSLHSAVLLQNGQVLVAGGNTLTVFSELYDPITHSWSLTGKLLTAREGHTMNLLPNGTVLATGGRTRRPSQVRSLCSSEIFNPDTKTWTGAAQMAEKRSFHTATRLDNGTILVAGGEGDVLGVISKTAELYRPPD